MHEDEFVAAEAELNRLRETARDSADEIRRADDELERIELDRRALSGEGQAVSASDIDEARQRRDEVWGVLREALVEARTLPDAVTASDRFAADVGSADVLADRRFAFAEESGRLGLLDKQAGEVYVLFEIKTRVEPRDVFEGLGQLAVYEKLLKMPFRKVLLVPEGIGAGLLEPLARLKVIHMEYRRRGRKVVCDEAALSRILEP